MLKKIFLLLSIFFFLGNWTFAEIKIPEYHGYVNDYANLFTKQEEQKLENKIKNIEKKTSVEIGILTIESLNGQPLFDYSMAVARGWGIGKKDKNNGLLILIAKKERKIRIEVGYGLEGTITDAQAFWLIDNILKPAFRKNQYFQGVNEVLDKVGEAVAGEYVIPKGIPDFLKVWLFIFGGGAFILLTAGFLWFFNNKKYNKISIKKIKTDINPFIAGVLIDNKIDNWDLMAGILYLANKGYISIQKNKKNNEFVDNNYIFTLKRKIDENTDELDKELLKLIFDKSYWKNKGCDAGVQIFLEDILKKDKKISKRKNIVSKWIKKYLVKNNFYNTTEIEVSKGKLMVAILLTNFSTYYMLSFNNKIFAFIPIIVLFVWYSFESNKIYTKKGKDVIKNISELLMYIKYYSFKNKDERTNEVFLKFLPYAYAFSLENDWSDKFYSFIADVPWYLNDKEQDIQGFMKDLEEISKIVGGVKVGHIHTHTGGYDLNSGDWLSSSDSDDDFGGGDFGGGGASGSW